MATQHSDAMQLLRHLVVGGCLCVGDVVPRNSSIACGSSSSEMRFKTFEVRPVGWRCAECRPPAVEIYARHVVAVPALSRRAACACILRSSTHVALGWPTAHNLVLQRESYSSTTTGKFPDTARNSLSLFGVKYRMQRSASELRVV